MENLRGDSVASVFVLLAFGSQCRTLGHEKASSLDSGISQVEQRWAAKQPSTQLLNNSG